MDEGALVSGKDRLYHELSTLVEILYQGGTYDQLNVGAAASLEIASRRLIAIVEATSKGLDSPNWETARHYTGTSTVFDLAPHELRACATRAAKDEAEIDSVRTRGRYVAVAVGGLPRADDVGAAGAKSVGKDKGKRNAKGGRGGEARVPLGTPRAHEPVSCVGAARPTWRKQSACQQLASSAAAGEVDRVCGEPADEESVATCQAGGRRGRSGDQLAPRGGLPPKAGAQQQ